MKKKIIFIIASQKFRDEEYLEPKRILEDGGFEIETASSRIGEITGMLGAKAQAKWLLNEIVVSNYEAVVFIGGAGATEYFDDPTAIHLASQAATVNKPLAAICIAPSILANAGVLQGKRATSWPGEKSNLTRNGAIFTDNGVEVDGFIITAAGPEFAIPFGQALLDLLN